MQNQFDIPLKVITPVDDLVKEKKWQTIELEDNQQRKW